MTLPRWAATALRIVGLAVPLYAAREGLEKHVALGSGLDLEQFRRHESGSEILSLKHNKTHVTCWVQLFFEASGTRGTIQASLSNGQPVSTSVVPTSNDLIQVDVRPSKQDLEKPYLAWPSGHALNVSHDGPPLILKDWIVWREGVGGSYDDQPDNKDKAWWRGVYDLTFAALFILATIEAVWSQRTNRQPSGGEQEDSSPRGLVNRLIDGIEGDSDSETTLLRRFLKKVLIDGAPFSEGAATLKKVPYTKQIQIRNQAVERLSSRLQEMKAEISDWQAMLRKCVPP